MSDIAFIGDCFVDSEISIEPSTNALPENVVLNWEHAYPVEGHQIASKVSLGLDGRHYRSSFKDKRVFAGLANNHALDYGAAGLEKSKEVIKSNQWMVCGTSRNDGTGAVCVLEFGEKRVALLFYAHETSSPVTDVDGIPWISRYDRAKLASDIHAAKSQGASYLVAYIHWGAEEVYLPTPDIVIEARRMIDAGVDLIVGHHAHVVQPIEVYKDKYIFYGVGNFYFPHLSTTILRNTTLTNFMKTQARRNKKSLVVVLNTADMSIRVKRGVANLKYRTVFLSKARVRATLITKFPYYSAIFKISYIFGKLRYKIHSIISERRLPKASMFVNIIKLIRENNYK